MAFVKKAFRWLKRGVVPPETMQESGFKVNDGLPADYLNEALTANYEAIEELQEKVVEHTVLTEHAEKTASTTQSGHVKLSTSTSSTSTTLAATASAVKTAYDKATTAQTTADNAANAAANAKTIAESKASTDVATTSANGLMSSNDKTKLDGIAAGANNYALPNATTSVVGGVKVGTNISVSSGTISVANASTNAKGVVQLNDTVTSTSTSLAATASAVKMVADSLTTHSTDTTSHNTWATCATSGNTTEKVATAAGFTLVTGATVSVKFTYANTTTTPTLNVNSTGAKALKKPNGNAFTNIVTGGVYTFVYDGSNFIVQGEGGEYGTATADDVLVGKTIGTESGVVDGTMPNNGAIAQTLPANGSYTIPKGYHDGNGQVTQSLTTKSAQTYTPKTTDQTIASGQYLSGTQTIRGDADLVASNIKKGVDIFGVLGTLDLASLGGKKYASGNCVFSKTINGSMWGISISGLSLTTEIGLIDFGTEFYLFAKRSDGTFRGVIIANKNQSGNGLTSIDTTATTVTLTTGTSTLYEGSMGTYYFFGS